MRPITRQSAAALLACIMATAGSWALCLWGPGIPLPYHKFQHIGCFAFWTLTLAWSMRLWLVFSRQATVIASVLLGVAASAVGELAQFGMSNHTPEWQGFGWSVAGVAVAESLVLAGFAAHRAARRSPRQ